ncbi:MAG: M20/M25/M40 family metallo-hydrolase [Lachnoclostridium sp.]|nr:M20/M25/M40 family metallo-hydrolase [Lachnospira sp.]MCM1248237.1 M20/M25/M40 family metallo-hydrolase [Lachnoclostridium sp.]MCM1534975.1 M20/M25/M40 family metallo-hydrolase [Clostridium sp.]
MISGDFIKETFSELVSIDSPSLNERAMKDHMKAMFLKLGIELEEDASASITGSNAGNLYGYVKGNGQPPILLSAHMDTVMPGLGKKAVFHKDGKITSDGTTVLGADDVSGITAIYAALCNLHSNSMEHRDIELLFTTGEELYCKGAKAFDYKRVKSKSTVVLDLSGEIGDAAYAAPTIFSIEAKIQGKSAHAGFCPEEGIHAIKACCEAVAHLPQGHIDEVTTANIGLIAGGDGINIVPKECVVKGEVRSLCHERAQAVAEQWKQIFVENVQKCGARLQWKQQMDIQAYETSQNSRIIRDYEKACKRINITPHFVKSFGGSDNNVFAQNGIEGIVIATSMNNVHGCEEYADVAEISKVSEILIGMLA